MIIMMTIPVRVTPATPKISVTDGRLGTAARCVSGSVLRTATTVILWIYKKKGNSQVTSGIHVPSVLNKLPFAPNVAQEKATVNIKERDKYERLQ